MRPHRTETIIEPASGEKMAIHQIEPNGVWVAAPPIKARVHGVVKMVPEQGGSGRFIPQIKKLSESVPLTRDLLESLGIPIKDSCLYLRKLAHAGFIKIRHVTPQHCHVDLASLVEFFEATEDPDFWTPQRKHAYHLACLSIKK